MISPYKLSNPINLTAYDNDNVTKVPSGIEYDSGAYVLVNKTLDDDGDKISKPFQDPTDPVALDMPAEARKVELRVVALDDGDGTTDTYTVKLKLDSIDPSASDKVAIWQVPEGGVEAIQTSWDLKVGGSEGMTPAIPILTMTEGDDPKTLTLWFEGREPVVDSGMPIRLVAELYKGTDTLPMVTDAIKLNPIEISYLRPALVEVTEDVEELHCQTVAVGRVSSTNAWISEVMAEPGSGHAKWIELYNPTNEDIVFTNDNILVANETEHFLVGDTIPAKGFLVLANDADDDGLGELSNVVYKGGLNPVGEIEIYEGESVVLTADVGDSTTGISRYFAFNDPSTDEQVWWDSALPWTGSGELLGSPGEDLSGGVYSYQTCETEIVEGGRHYMGLRCADPGTPPSSSQIDPCGTEDTLDCWCEELGDMVTANSQLVKDWLSSPDGTCGYCERRDVPVSEMVPDEETCGSNDNGTPNDDSDDFPYCRVEPSLRRMVEHYSATRIRVDGVDYDKMDYIKSTGTEPRGDDLILETMNDELNSLGAVVDDLTVTSDKLLAVYSGTDLSWVERSDFYEGFGNVRFIHASGNKVVTKGDDSAVPLSGTKEIIGVMFWCGRGPNDDSDDYVPKHSTYPPDRPKLQCTIKLDDPATKAVNITLSADNESPTKGQLQLHTVETGDPLTIIPIQFLKDEQSKTFWVSGEYESTNVLDAKFRGFMGTDNSPLGAKSVTVVWVEMSVRSTQGELFSDDNEFNATIVPPNLGCDVYFINGRYEAVSYIVEYVGQVKPTDFRDKVFLTRSNTQMLVGNPVLPSEIYPPQYSPDDTSSKEFRTEIPSSKGRVFDVDGPGFKLAFQQYINAPVGQTVDVRHNFTEWAEIGGMVEGSSTTVRASQDLNTFVRLNAVRNGNSGNSSDWGCDNANTSFGLGSTTLAP